MKFLLKNVATAIVPFMLFNCSVEQLDTRTENNVSETTSISTSFNCTSGSCGARLTNNGTFPVDLAIYNHNGILLFEAQSIAVGLTTAWQSLPTGQISYHVTTQADNFTKVIDVNMSECMVYDMEVAENDMLTSDIPNSGI